MSKRPGAAVLVSQGYEGRPPEKKQNLRPPAAKKSSNPALQPGKRRVGVRGMAVRQAVKKQGSPLGDLTSKTGSRIEERPAQLRREPSVSQLMATAKKNHTIKSQRLRSHICQLGPPSGREARIEKEHGRAGGKSAGESGPSDV